MAKNCNPQSIIFVEDLIKPIARFNHIISIQSYRQWLVTKVTVVAKFLYASPKHFDKLKLEPGPRRKPQPDVQLWISNRR